MNLAAGAHATPTASSASSGVTSRRGHRRKTSAGVKKKSFAVRVPSDVYAKVCAISTATGDSVNTVLENGIHYYVAYSKSDAFRERLTRLAAQRVEAFDAYRDMDEADANADPREKGDAPPIAAVSTVLRVDPALEGNLKQIKGITGWTSLNEVIVDATRIYVDRLPKGQEFRDLVVQNLQVQADALRELGKEELLREFAQNLS